MAAKIVIIDDHQLFREGVKRILEFNNRFEVVAEGQDGLDALGLIDTYHPDVVIMDINMPNMNGIEATRQLIEKHPDTKVVILSIHDDESNVMQAMRTGACGYLLKDMDAGMLVEAVNIVVEGGCYLHPRVTHNLVNEYRRLVAVGSDVGYESTVSSRQVGAQPADFGPFQQRLGRDEVIRPLHLLTKRECEVLQQLANGKSNRGIGEAIYISEKTVKNHVSSILQKMNVNDRTQAVVVAIKNQWVDVR